VLLREVNSSDPHYCAFSW